MNRKVVEKANTIFSGNELCQSSSYLTVVKLTKNRITPWLWDLTLAHNTLVGVDSCRMVLITGSGI